MKIRLSRHSLIPASLLIVLLHSAACGLSQRYSTTSTPATSDFGAEEVDTSAPVKIDIFSARGFLGGSEYERYYLTGNILWRECGTISNAHKQTALHTELEGDQVFRPDPQLTIQERRVERLSKEERKKILQTAASVLKASAERSIPEPPPGSVFSLADPGMFELLLAVDKEKKRIITSVDAVADRHSPTLDKAHELFATLRGIGPCVIS